jgi:uncharacterized surface protein with fasciclin (FAS1) repeats
VLTIPGKLTNTLVTGGLTAFAGALQRAGVESPINNARDVTVFAPVNDGFSAIGTLVDSMTSEQLAQVLNYHVVQGKVLYSWLITAGTHVTVQGGSLNLKVVNGEMFVNGAKIISSDVLVGNGVVHVLDAYVQPLSLTLPSHGVVY